jgi:hypothetical protein
MIPSSIIEAFAGRFDPRLGTTDAEVLARNIESLTADLRSAEALVAIGVSIAQREQSEPPPPPAVRDTTLGLPEQLAKSPALRALAAEAGPAIAWPRKPTRAFLSNVVAYINTTTDADKVELCRRLGVVIRARHLSRCWPCRDGKPLDAVQLFFSPQIFDQLVAAAAKVRT